MSFKVNLCSYVPNTLFGNLTVDESEIPEIDFGTLYGDNPNRESAPVKKILGFVFTGTNAYNIKISLYQNYYYYRFYPFKKFDIYKMPLGYAYSSWTSWYYDPYAVSYPQLNQTLRKEYRIKALPINSQNSLDIFNSSLSTTGSQNGAAIGWKNMYDGYNAFAEFNIGNALMDSNNIALSSPIGITIVVPGYTAETEEVNIENIKLRMTFDTYE